MNQTLLLPFPSGHTWYICQSYVGFSHKGNRPFDIGWTKASCNAANDDSGGKPISAPGAGTISYMPTSAAGGDFMCLSLTGGGSIVLGHVKPASGIAIGSKVSAGQLVATVRTRTDPAAQNAGIAHLHFEAFAGDRCYVGAPQPFTGAWRMKCAPDLPYVATYGFYNGTALDGCVEDAGLAPEPAVEAGPAPSAPSPERGLPPVAGVEDPTPVGEDGCAIAAPSAGLLEALVVVLVAAAFRRRRSA
jgi:hypothetical protein